MFDCDVRAILDHVRIDIALHDTADHQGRQVQSHMNRPVAPGLQAEQWIVLQEIYITPDPKKSRAVSQT